MLRLVIEARGQHCPHWAADLVQSTRSSSAVLEVGSQSSGTSSPWEPLEKQILRSHPRPTAAESARVGPSHLCLNKPARCPGAQTLVHRRASKKTGLDLRPVPGAPPASAQAAPPSVHTAGPTLPSRLERVTELAQGWISTRPKWPRHRSPGLDWANSGQERPRLAAEVLRTPAPLFPVASRCSIHPRKQLCRLPGGQPVRRNQGLP